ncbi:MAG: tRNA pseudouridine(38-40) synthase TruA [Planctomycetes bacterium]|nr:tRNA pseudouridine(38-40) synthase TruA [Planctomycetota bacterium]
MAMRNIKLIIAYDGSSYHGWQRQPDADTIQQQIEDAGQKLFGEKISVTGSSRTDAGVSALGQVASFNVDSAVPTENIARALNGSLDEKIAVVSAEEVDEDFNAIRSTKGKLYRYSICTSQIRPVLDIKHCWHYPYKLGASQMDIAAKLLVGKKDFKSFASAADTRQSSVRTIISCKVFQEGDWIHIEVEGDGFLYNMVRNIAGTLVEIGRGRWAPEIITEILAAKDRTVAGPLAPAYGLCLVRIDY